MANETTNYNLTKPTEDEFYDVAVQNDNMDKIDTAMKGLEDNKVSQVVNKGLSTNDYTTDEKEKLSGIATNAQVNTVEGVMVNGVAVTLDSNKKANIPVPVISNVLTNTSTSEGLSAAQGKVLKDLADGHIDKNINTETGVHGIRYYEDKLSFFNGTEWVEIETGGGSKIPIYDIPSAQADSFTYDGAVKTPVWNNYDSSKLTIGGTTSATAAGTYTTTFTPTENYWWDDATTDAKSVTWTIEKATISTTPSQSGSLTYSGSTLTPSWSNYDSSKLTLGGTTTGINAGSYSATFTPTANYKWSDDTTTAKTVSWTIGKASGTSSISKTAITLNTDTTVTTFTVTRSGDGTISATSSNTAVATVSVSGSTVTVASTGKTGTATITVAVAAGTNYTAASNKTCTITASFSRTMTVKIDLSNSNPSTCCTYYDDASDMTAGSDDWDEFFGHKPCLFLNGAVSGYLNPDNYAQFEDGSSANITSGTYGDVMVEFPKRGLKISTSGTIVTISMTDDLDNADFEYNAHTRGTTSKDNFYLGAYHGYSSSSKLRSLSGKTPTVNQTIGAFRTLAQANGDGYEQWAFYQLLFLQCMYVLKYKDLDSQTTIGQGYTGGSAATTTGARNTSGMDYGTTSATVQMKLFGIEDFYGNVRNWIDGLYCSSSWQILTGNDNFNDTGSGYTNNGAGATADISGYMTSIQGSTKTGFITKVGGGSATTYFCDYAALYDGCVAYFGGRWNGGGDAGAFRLRVDFAASDSSSTVAARLMYL